MAAALLLTPWLELLASTWNGDSKGAAQSILSFAAACALGWLRRDAFTAPQAGRAAIGMPLLAIAAFGFGLSVVFDVRLFAGVLAVGILACLVYLEAGARAARRLALPFALLAMATPIPAFVEGALTHNLVALTVSITPPLLQPIVGPIEVEGAVLHLTGGSVAVVDDCSGLGGVLLFVPIAILLFAVHPRTTTWRGGVLLAIATPLAFAGSLLRVIVSALLVHFDAPLAESETAHEVLGIVTLTLALAGLLVASRVTLGPGAQPEATA